MRTLTTSLMASISLALIPAAAWACSPHFSGPDLGAWVEVLPANGLIPLDSHSVDADLRHAAVSIISVADGKSLPLKRVEAPWLDTPRGLFYFRAAAPPDPESAYDSARIGSETFDLPRVLRFTAESDLAPPPAVEIEVEGRFGTFFGIPGSCQSIDFGLVHLKGAIEEGWRFNVHVADERGSLGSTRPSLVVLEPDGLDEGKPRLVGTLSYFGKAGQWVAVAAVDPAGNVGPLGASLQIPTNNTNRLVFAVVGLAVLVLALAAAVLFINRRRLRWPE